MPIPAIDCFSHFSSLEGGLSLVDRRCLLLTCDYLAMSEASSGSEMRGVRNSYPYILFRFPVVSVLLAVCHDCQLANLYWQLAERQSREF